MHISITYDGTTAICKIDNKDFADCSTLDKYLTIKVFDLIKNKLWSIY